MAATTVGTFAAVGLSKVTFRGKPLVVVAVLITGPEQRKLPRELLGGTRENLDPSVMAIATLLVLFSTVLLLVFNAMQNRSRKLRG